jgi:hypothetical protein
MAARRLFVARMSLQEDNHGQGSEAQRARAEEAENGGEEGRSADLDLRRAVVIKSGEKGDEKPHGQALEPTPKESPWFAPGAKSIQGGFTSGRRRVPTNPFRASHSKLVNIALHLLRRNIRGFLYNEAELF